MTKTELIKRVQETLKNTGKRRFVIPETMLARVFEALGSIAGEELVRGGEVPLPGLGKLDTKLRRGRWGRNPQAGDRIYIQDCRCVAIRPSKALKAAVRETAA